MSVDPMHSDKAYEFGRKYVQHKFYQLDKLSTDELEKAASRAYRFYNQYGNDFQRGKADGIMTMVAARKKLDGNEKVS